MTITLGLGFIHCFQIQFVDFRVLVRMSDFFKLSLILLEHNLKRHWSVLKFPLVTSELLSLYCQVEGEAQGLHMAHLTLR